MISAHRLCTCYVCFAPDCCQCGLGSPSALHTLPFCSPGGANASPNISGGRDPREGGLRRGSAGAYPGMGGSSRWASNAPSAISFQLYIAICNPQSVDGGYAAPSGVKTLSKRAQHKCGVTNDAI